MTSRNAEPVPTAQDPSATPADGPVGVPGRDLPGVGVLVVIWRNARILLIRRSKAPFAGYWGVPGGRVEPRETLKAAAERELLEETGIRGDAVCTLPVLEQISPESHWVLVPVACAWESGEPAAADDVDRAGWFDPEDLPSPRIPGLDDLIAASMPSVTSSRY